MELKEWRLKAPFITAAEVIDAIQVLQVTVSRGGISGRSETMGVDYLNETVESLQAELAALDPATIAELDGELLQSLLPPGGSRNGLDCALWDLKAKQIGRRHQRADGYFAGASQHAIHAIPG